jgi:hypothetical protein
MQRAIWKCAAKRTKERSVCKFSECAYRQRMRIFTFGSAGHRDSVRTQ